MQLVGRRTGEACRLLSQLARPRDGERLQIHRLPLHLHGHLRLSERRGSEDRRAGGTGVFNAEARCARAAGVGLLERSEPEVPQGAARRRVRRGDGSGLLLFLGARYGGVWTDSVVTTFLSNREIYTSTVFVISATSAAAATSMAIRQCNHSTSTNAIGLPLTCDWRGFSARASRAPYRFA